MDDNLPEVLIVTVDGQTRELFMSFALLNRCTALVGDPDRIEFISMNPELRDAILCEVFSERDSKGKVTKAIQMDEVSIPFIDIENALDWVTEHVLNFMVRALERASKRKTKNQGKLSELMSSLLGANTSNSPKSAA